MGCGQSTTKHPDDKTTTVDGSPPPTTTAHAAAVRAAPPRAIPNHHDDGIPKKGLHTATSPGQHATRTKQPESAPRHAFLLPTDKGFHPSYNGRNGYEFSQLYQKTKEQLDGGNFGAIYRCRHRHGKLQPQSSSPEKDEDEEDWTIGAVKITKPNALDTYHGAILSYDDIEARCQEIRTLSWLQQEPRSNRILRLQEFFYHSETKELSVVTELLEKNLRDWIDEQDTFTERQGRAVATILLEAIQFMHSRGIVHRDIKEANVVFQKTGNLKTLKVVDFGLAKQIGPGESEKAFCGSLGYIAPEIYMKEPYRFEVDLFSFGVLMFKILSGKRPWPAGPPEETGRRTVHLEYRIVNEQWKNVSRNARNFIRNLLAYREARLTAAQAIQHEWLGDRTESVLRTGGASLRRMDTASPSDAVINPEGASETQDTREKTRFWIDENVQDALIGFARLGAFHGTVVTNQQGHALMEEVFPTNGCYLPRFIIEKIDNYTERECRNICREIAFRVKQFHDGGVVHRKLHMESVVVESQLGAPDFNVSLRLVQFAQMIREDQPLTGRVGRLNQMRGWSAFVAPEIESEFYHDKRVDLWSLGTIIYMCLTGTAPLKPDLLFQFVTPSMEAQHLVRNLLQINPGDRLSIEEVLNHPWMTESDHVLATRDLGIAKIMFQDWDRSGRRDMNNSR